MNQIETLKRYAQQKTEQQVSSLVDAPEMIRQVQAMRQELAQLPEATVQQIAQVLEPLDRLDRTLDQHLSIIQPLIDQATKQMQKQIDGLAHDRVQRSVTMAREQHRKAREASRVLKGWMGEAKTSRTKKAEMQEQISKLTIRFRMATGSAATLAAVLALMILGRFL